MSAWLAYICSVQGHVRQGVGVGTNHGDIVFSSYCSRCGERVAYAADAHVDPFLLVDLDDDASSRSVKP